MTVKFVTVQKGYVIAEKSILLQDLFGVHLSQASMARFVRCCYQHLAEWETALKAAMLKRRVLHMKAIRHHYLSGLYFELSYLDVGYDDYSPLLACRRFEAQLEDTCE